MWCQTEQERAQLIIKFISIGKKLLEMGNFNSLLAIVAALSMAAVSRLQKTWASVEKADKQAVQVCFVSLFLIIIFFLSIIYFFFSFFFLFFSFFFLCDFFIFLIFIFYFFYFLLGAQKFANDF